MARSTRRFRLEAEQLRRQGMTYTEIATSGIQRYGFNPRAAFRLAHGLTQAQVADRWNELWPDPDTPKTAKHVSYWEIWPAPGGRAPSLETLNRLALIYQCRAGDLLGGEDHSHLDPAVTAESEPAASSGGDVASAEQPRTQAELLTVAIAVVVNETQVLLVSRRDTSEGIHWGFPTGVVKPGAQPADVAVRETLTETGVHCSAQRELGTRIHPLTGAFCKYFRCHYLAGTVENRDVVENASVLWVNRDEITSFVPAHLIFPPILDTLEDLEDAVPPPDTPHDDNRPTIAAAVITTDDRVLLVKRRVAEGTLSWAFPSGSQEPGESAAQAAVREAREEVGLEVTAHQLLGERTHPATGRHMVYVSCRAAGGEAHLADTDELAELAWCRRDELDEYVPHGLFPPVDEHLRHSLAM